MKKEGSLKDKKKEGSSDKDDINAGERIIDTIYRDQEDRKLKKEGSLGDKKKEGPSDKEDINAGARIIDIIYRGQAKKRLCEGISILKDPGAIRKEDIKIKDSESSMKEKVNSVEETKAEDKNEEISPKQTDSEIRREDEQSENESGSLVKDENDKEAEVGARNSGISNTDQEAAKVSSVDRGKSEIVGRKISNFLVKPTLISTKPSPKAKRRPKQAKKFSPGKNQLRITNFTNSTRNSTQLNPARLINEDNINTLGNWRDLTETKGDVYLSLEPQMSESVTKTIDEKDNLNLLKRTEDNILESNKGDSKEDFETVEKLTGKRRPICEIGD